MEVDAHRPGRVRCGVRFSTETLVVGGLALCGLRIGLWPISDNSAFTHLATGIRMVADGVLPAIPRVDPYTFTAAGEPWVVQSWLAEAGVGWAHRLGGESAVTVLSGVTMAALAWLVASLARTGRPARTGVAAGAALLVGAPLWSPRPLLVGLLCLGLTILVVERRWSPWWLLPVVWVWVNSHGSFPLGLLWLLLAAAGAWVDRRRDPHDAAVPLGYLVAFSVGVVAGALNPLGPRLLTFAATAVTKREVFSHVVEWQSPDFQSGQGVVMLAGLVLGMGVLVRSGVGWRYALPAAVFLGLGLTAERNLAPLGIVLAPALGRALRTDDAPPMDRGHFRAGALALAAIAVVIAVAATQTPLVDATNYPVGAVTWLEEHHRFDAPHRVVTTDVVGNYLELRRGPHGEVFIDDRIDLFPVAVTRDYIAMRNGADRGIAALNRWRIDTVVWEASGVLAQRLSADSSWTVAARRGDWLVLVRRPD